MVRPGLVALLVWAASGAVGSEYAHFAQSAVASHRDGSQHRWPCMARLADGRVLIVWSRLAKGEKEDAIVGAFSTDCGCSWRSPQTLIANEGLVDADPSIVVSGDRVLVTCTSVSFAKGIRTSATWCVRSDDGAKTWSAPYEIPMGHQYTCGKTHRGLCLRSGVLLMGYSWDVLCEQGETHRSEGEMDLRAGVMRSTDNGESWTNAGDTHATYQKVAKGAVLGTDEPALVELDDGAIYMLMRTGTDHLYEARSTDDGQTWRDIRPSPLRGSNAPAALTAFEAGGRRGILAVWDNALVRYPLCAAASFDAGRTWSTPKDIGHPYTGGQASYPSCEQAPDGTLLAVWQQDVEGGRDVRLARFSLAWLLEDKPAVPTGAADLPDTSGPDRHAVTIVAFGDSTSAPRGPLLTFARLLEENLRQRCISAKVINAGVGGNTTAMARARFEDDVLARKPDIVTISFGINDSAVDVWKNATNPRVSIERYEANLRYFVQELLNREAQPIVMTPNALAWTDPLREMYAKPPYDPCDPDGFNVLLKRYASVARNVAKTEGVPLVDIYRLFEQYAEAGKIRTVLLDGMHPSDLGHRLIADRLIPLIPAMLPAGNGSPSP